MSGPKDDLAGFDLTTEQQRLFARLLEEEGIEVAKPLSAISREASVSEQMPLSFAQQRLWLLEQLEPGTSLYHIPVTLRLTGPLDQNALQQALTEIVRRHEVLRAGLDFRSEQPTQVITPPATWDVGFQDLSHLPEAEKEAQALIDRLAQEPFDLGKGRLVRAKLLRVAGDDHLLAMVMHHIASDGSSFGILFQELSSLYTTFSQGKPSSLPDLSVQYADYAIWQRNWLQGKALISQLDYWKQQLRGAPELLELPADYQRPATHSLRGGRLNTILPAELVADLENLSRREGVTLFMALLAATKLLLWRYTGQPDVVVGIPISGRSRTEFEKLIGLFINTLVLRTELSGDLSFRELIARVRDVCIGAYDHQEMPFEKLVEELQPQRSLNHTPLFQVFFNMFMLSEGLPELPGLKVKGLNPPEIGSKFDLTFYVQHYNHQLMITLAYNKDLFADDRIQEMLEQLTVLLAGIAHNPDASINSYSLSTSRARKVLPDPTRTLLPEWKGSIASLFAEQARLTPDRLAVKDKDGAWTYRQLDELSNQIANRLLDTGLARQDIVAIYANRGASIVLAVLGILKGGGAFMILDPAYPARRLIDYLRAAQPKAWLQGPGSLAPELEEFIAESSLLSRLPLADVADVFKDSPVTDPAVAVEPRDLAYVAFTSGSTGKPKGVMGTHDSLTHYPNWLKETFAVNESDRFSMLSGLAHDPLLRDIFSPLALGAALCIPDPEFFDVPGRLAVWMQAEKITIANLTPAMGELLTTGATGDDCPTLTDLRGAFFVGDALTRSSISSFRKLAPSATCINLYGTTETQRSLSYYVVPAGESAAAATTLNKEVIPVGQGIHGVQLLVLRDGRQLAGIGELGEIYFRGPYLARGYLEDDAVTRQQFLINPLTNAPGDRLYKTGDLGRYLLDGNVEIAGRSDEQVKIRGYRIELGEIEGALRRQDGIEKCAVLARERPGGERQLVAYLVRRREANVVESSELRRRLESELPQYMIPSAFVMLKDLPLTPNGKLDRDALPAPEQVRPDIEASHIEASTPIEEMIAAIVAEVLHLDQVGVHENFFDLGGHSLLAMQLVARVRAVFHVSVPLRDLFETPTVAGLAASIEKHLSSSSVAEAPPIVHLSPRQELPLSFGQQRLWLLDQLESQNAAYNLPLSLRLRGKLDEQSLARALAEIVRRHEVLRSSVELRAGEPVQVLGEDGFGGLERVDLSHLEGEEAEQEARQLVNQVGRRPFDLGRGPLLRAQLLRLAAAEHVLLVVMHHIASDGWSLGVFARELSRLYEAYHEGRESPLEELGIQYGDYAQWQRQWLSGEVLDAQLDYWRRQLSGAPAVLELPTDRPRPVLQSFDAGVVKVELSRELKEQLAGLGRQRGCTLFMVLLAGFQVLLARYAGVADVVVGTPVAGRVRRETEALIGFFVNTLVLRTKVRGEESFEQLLLRVREICLGAYGHQDLPFEKLVEELQPQRSLSHAPLFQVFFALQNLPRHSLSLSNLLIQPQPVEDERAKFDLTVNIIDKGGSGLEVRAIYRRDLFDEGTVSRILGHYEQLLKTITTGMQRKLWELSPMTAAEREQVLVGWNQAEREYEGSRCVHECFEAQADRAPEAAAVEFEEEQLSYSELNARANQLAHYLRSMGVGPEVLVGVLLERSVELLVAVLGVLKAGGAYVPLDAAYPRQRLLQMLDDGRVRVLLTGQQLADFLAPGGALEVVCLDTAQAAISQHPAVNPRRNVSAHNLAYVIFTSGSTGRPKGVQIAHAAVVNLLRSMSEQPGLSSEDVLLSVTPLTFDIAALELFLPLMVGASAVMVSRQVAANGVELNKRLSSRISVMQATPATWRLLLASGWRGNERLKILCGGEALSPPLAQQLLTRGASLWNLYGPTETTIWSALHEVTAAGQLIPIGRPIANTALYLLDNNFEPVPVGAVGELYIGGAGLARGYLNPAQTAERFLPHPFSATPGARLYRTGDLARYAADGKIQFIGRQDEQVKVHGYRIELGEIEATLSSQQEIEECVVQVRAGADGEPRLVAYLVRQPGTTTVVESAEWRRRLEATLPQYMIPAAFVELDRLPLTGNGKVDRQALAALPLRWESDAGGEAPATPVEELLAGIWMEVLGVKAVSRGANFFELGGHSLLLTQVMVRVREVLGVELPLRLLFELPALAELASEVERQRGRSEGQAAPAAIVHLSPRQELPLSFAQQRLWLLDQLEPQNAAYNLPLALRLRGQLDEPALARALAEIVRRHEVLRSSVALRAGEPVQVLGEDGADGFGGLERVDLSHLEGEEAEQEARQLVNQVGRRPFDLGRGPLLRAQLLRLAADEHVLVVVMHHIASDGWSLGVFAHELSRLYEAYHQGQESPLQELAIQYGDYAQWQRQWLKGEVAQQLSYWRAQLSGAPAVLELPTDRPRPAVQSFNAGVVKLELSRELKEQLAGLGRSQGCTLFMVLLAGFQVLLARYAGVADVVVGTPVAGRVRRETEALIGFFVNTLVLRTKVRGEESFEQLLLRVRELCLGAYEHQDLPFEKLVEELQPQRSLSHAPLFQVFFALQNLPRHSLSLSNLLIQPQPVDTERVAHDLSLMLAEQADGSIAGGLRYATALFDSTTIERLVTNFLTLLHAIVAHPAQPVSNLPLLADQERQLLLADWNDTSIAYPLDRCLHQLFEAQVSRTPDQVALVFEDQQLTYTELNARANQLAHYLRSMGSEPEARVGILVERSAEMMIGLLGILKSGAAYVPLDPNYPQERLSFMLADAGVKILVTQSHLAELLPVNTRVVCLDDEGERIALESDDQVDSAVRPGNAAYVIYTSGSTGKPKGVVVCHQNVINFVTGMDQRIGGDKPGVWLSVTSISFDISVLELFWTLARGYKVIIQGSEQTSALAAEDSGEVALKGMDFSLFYFASDEASHEKDIYKLLIQGAKFADEHNFTAVWTPERHFHAFGGPYPNPAVTGAALATITKRIQIRAGSVVVPLHDPIRVAEEWAVIDNLSNGRVSLSFASGWHANDFVFSPESYAKRHEVMFKNIEIIRSLWRGEAITRRSGGAGDIEVVISPRPIQPELPIWITAAGSPKTFETAGEMGANLLTHLLGQSLEELKAKIDLYRAAWRRNHHGPGSGHVTLMLHAFIDPDEDRVLEKVRQPFTNYLRSSLGLLQGSAKSLGRDLNLANLSEVDMQAVLDHSFARYYETSSLMGTPARCLEIVNQLKVIGVDEIGCLIDFGVDADSVLSGLEHLNALRESSNRRARKRRENYSIGEQIRRHHVTHMQCTPSLARMLSAEPGGLASLHSLEKFLLGGEALPLSLAKQVREEFPGELFNMYGPTETTIWSSTHRLTETETMVPLGMPIANTRIYILDRNLQLCPIGTPGELFIGGAGVVRGYLNRPDLTAERFLPDPFGTEPGATMYQTGDLARYRPGGEIEFLGRLDYQVKLRGFRVEMGEIEAVVESHPDVKSCVVVPYADGGQDPRLIAYVVPVDEQVELSISDLRRHVKQSLPEYMQPAIFVPLQALPLTPNGKVDRKALPDPDPERPALETTFVAARTPIEEIVAGIWASLLRLDKVGAEDNFFELGGHSLLAMQVIAMLRGALQVEIPARVFFESPTVAGLASNIETLKTLPVASESPIQPTTRESLAPLSINQEARLFREWRQSMQSAPRKQFHTRNAFRFHGKLDADVLEHALNEVIRRHEALRAIFIKRQGGLNSKWLVPILNKALALKGIIKRFGRFAKKGFVRATLYDQIIVPEATLKLQRIDLRHLDETGREAEFQRMCTEEIGRLFDYSQAPLFRALLVTFADEEHGFCLVVHHFVCDGWSASLIMREVAALYPAFLRGEPSPLAEPRLQFRDFARWQRERLRGELLENYLEYWKGHLEGVGFVPELRMPFVKPRQSPLDYRGARQNVTVPGSLLKALLDMSRRRGITMYMLMLASIKTLLYQYTRKEHIGVFTPYANRVRPEATAIIGWLANFHVLCSDLSGNPKFSELLNRVRESVLGAYVHQEVPSPLLFVSLLDHFQGQLPKRLFEVPTVSFALVNRTRQSPPIDELKVTPIEILFNTGDPGSLEFVVIEEPNELTIEIRYLADSFDPKDIECMLENLVGLLEAIVAEPETKLSDFSLRKIHFSTQ